VGLAFAGAHFSFGGFFPKEVKSLAIREEKDQSIWGRGKMKRVRKNEPAAGRYRTFPEMVSVSILLNVCDRGEGLSQGTGKKKNNA